MSINTTFTKEEKTPDHSLTLGFMRMFNECSMKSFGIPQGYTGIPWYNRLSWPFLGLMYLGYVVYHISYIPLRVCELIIVVANDFFFLS
jgi:hypothetical protein